MMMLQLASLFVLICGAVSAQLMDSRYINAIDSFNRVAKSAAISVDTHRNLQIGFDAFVELICRPFAQSLVDDDGFSPDEFDFDCSSSANGGPPFDLNFTLRPLCLSGTTYEAFFGEVCPGEICFSISTRLQVNGFLDVLMTEGNLTFTGDTDYQEIFARDFLEDGTTSQFVVLKGKTYECNKGVESCPTANEEEEPTATFDCSNIQQGAVVNTCPGTFFYDEFSLCPAGGAMTPTTDPIDGEPAFVLVPCFSGASTVMVRDKGPIKMMDLRIGDWVQVAGGDEVKYEPIYSFGHKNKKARAEYLAITTTTTGGNEALEISKNHMVRIANGGFVPAGVLQVGDRMVSSNGSDAVVKSIRTVQRKGVYAPFTESGTILVNDIIASTYIAYGESENLRIGNIDTCLTYQWLAHTFQSFHRLAYKWNLVGEETYSKKGVSRWVQSPHDFVSWLFRQHNTVVFPLVALGIVVFGLVSLVEVAPAALLLAALVLFVNIRRPAAPTTAKKRM